jgi:uncharacterized BrkB/YihY/UPF0761 family membrane protein
MLATHRPKYVEITLSTNKEKSNKTLQCRGFQMFGWLTTIWNFTIPVYLQQFSYLNKAEVHSGYELYNVTNNAVYGQTNVAVLLMFLILIVGVLHSSEKSLLMSLNQSWKHLQNITIKFIYSPIILSFCLSVRLFTLIREAPPTRKVSMKCFILTFMKICQDNSN